MSTKQGLPLGESLKTK